MKALGGHVRCQPGNSGKAEIILCFSGTCCSLFPALEVHGVIGGTSFYLYLSLPVGLGMAVLGIKVTNCGS